MVDVLKSSDAVNVTFRLFRVWVGNISVVGSKKYSPQVENLECHICIQELFWKNLFIEMSNLKQQIIKCSRSVA